MSAFLHPFAPPSKAEADFTRIVGAEGSTLTADDGSTYLDAIGGLWYCQVGYGRREIIDAIKAQLDRLVVHHTFDPFTNGPAAEAADAIAARSAHPDGRVFLATSGSEAIDTAIKLARTYHQRRGDVDRQVIVRRERGYHGTNLGGTTAQGIAANREGWGDLVPHFVEVPGDDVEALATTFAQHGERIAAVLTEPVQAAGGVHPPPDGYLAAARRLCDDHGALLVLDEVVCGFGRTGSWFASQTFDVTPDLTVFAKGVTSGYLPLSGVIVGPTVGRELEDPELFLRTGYTYSGHPTSCAAALANLALIEEEGLVERAHHVGEQLVAGFDALAGDGSIEGHRGVGAIHAVELGREAAPVRERMLAGGVVTRPIGTALAFCPPLVMTDDEIGRVIEVLAGSL